MEINQYQKEYKVPVYEIGADGKINPYSLFNYFQDIASEQAEKLGFGKDDLMKDNHFWVLSRMAANIDIWPGWEELIIIRTWPRGTDGIFAIRDYEASFSDGRVISTATSSWLIVDITSRRVQRPDYVLTKYNSGTEIKSAIGRNATKLNPIDINGKKSLPFRVRHSDLDLNMHTNNAMYIKWITDNYDLDFRMNHIPVSFEINYLSESRWNDEIFLISSTGEINDGNYYHSLVRSVDNKELCRMRIGWKDCRL
jgi:medium-chain acyl-[acyl-carrier-protein] hydrolase